MPQYLLLYRGGAPQKDGLSPQEIQDHLDKWQAWVEEHAKSGVMDPGKPLRNDVKLVESPDLVSDGPYSEAKEVIGGYSLVTCDTIEGAVEVAKGCPIFEYDGQVEVRPVTDVCLDPTVDH